MTNSPFLYRPERVSLSPLSNRRQWHCFGRQRESPETLTKLFPMLLRRLQKRCRRLSSGVQSQARSAGSAIGQGIRESQRVGAAQAASSKKTAQAGDKFQEMVEEYPFAVAIGFLGAVSLPVFFFPGQGRRINWLGKSRTNFLNRLRKQEKKT